MNLVNSFIEVNVDNGGDQSVVEFIAKLRFNQGQKVQEHVRRIFMYDFDKQFARMLADEFKAGEIWFDGSHYVWVKDGVGYDVEGVLEDLSDYVKV